MLRHAILAASLLALGACATQSAQTASTQPSGRDCFRNEDVFGYSVIDDRNVRVRVGTRAYVLTTTWDARELDWTQEIVIRSAQNWICTGNGLGVEIIGGRPPRHYPISSIVREPEEPAPTGS